MNDEMKLSAEEEELIAAISGGESVSISKNNPIKVPPKPEPKFGPDGKRLDPGLIDSESPVVPAAEPDPKAALAQDMKLLVALDEQSAALKDKVKEINDLIRASVPELYDQLDQASSLLQETSKNYSSLKADVSSAALAYYKLTNEKDPVLGVKVIMKKQRTLIVDRAKAVSWAVFNGHDSLLALVEDKYADLLQTGVIDGMPGSVDADPVPGVRISLKPYQSEGK